MAGRLNSALNCFCFAINDSPKFLGRFMVSVKSGLPPHLYFLLWIDSGRGDRDQEVVELNSKLLMRDERNKKQKGSK